jgi:hypothetical protein
VDLVDNCTGGCNSNQAELDGDTIGDACDANIDGDQCGQRALLIDPSADNVFHR